MDTPLILWKYLPADRADVLTHGRIRFSPPCDLNDPFESRPRVKASGAKAERRLRQRYADEKVVAEKAASFAAHAQRYGTEMLWAEVNRDFGVLSLSANPLQPVMWAHYAQAYRGFLLGFDARHEWLAGRPGDTDITRSARPVSYEITRPQVVVGGTGDVEREQFVVGSILTKHVAWQFEAEWRVLRCAADALPASACEGVTNLFPFPADALMQVVFGPRMDSQVERVIRGALRGNRYPRAACTCLVLPDDSFELTIDRE